MTVTTTGAVTTPAEVVARLRTTFESGRTRDAGWRDTQLRGLLRLLDEGRDELVDALVADLRRTPLQAAMLDLTSTRGEVVHARKNLKRWMRPRKVRTSVAARPGKAWYQHDPLGVVLVIGAWNYPVNLTLAPLVAALAAGNCAVVKPSEIAPATSTALARLLPLYLDPDAVAVVEGGADATQELLAQRLDHCFFTGSTQVGRAVLTAAAEQMIPVTLELGGKCPAIVTASADLGVAARRIAMTKLLNSGQTCVAPDHVLVDETVKDAFVAEVTTALRTMSEGSAVPIVNSRHAARLAGVISSAGGRTVLGGHVDVDNALADPTVVVDPDPGSSAMTDEIFGPVLPVVGVPSLDAAIAHVRAGEHPLATYLFTEDTADEARVLGEISTGGVVVNQVMLHLAVADLPFGGVGASGTGRYHGHWGFETFSNPKAVLRKPSRPDPRLIYPPYGKLTERIMRRVL